MDAFDAILFDFDGVLIDSEPLHWACWAEELAPFGIELTWEMYRECYMGMDDRDMLHQIAVRANPPLDWQALWDRYPAKLALFRRKMQNPPFSRELPDLLERPHSDHKLAVVSTSSLIEIEPPLEAANLRQHFDALVTGQDVQHRKPAPDPYLLAARLVGAKKPLVVEDSPVGIASAKAAGFEVLVVPGAFEMPSALRAHLSGGASPA